jgi:hypothetical protein
LPLEFLLYGDEKGKKIKIATGIISKNEISSNLKGLRLYSDDKIQIGEISIRISDCGAEPKSELPKSVIVKQDLKNFVKDNILLHPSSNSAKKVVSVTPKGFVRKRSGEFVSA